MKIIEITPGVRRVIKDLEEGATFTVTYGDETTVTLSGKHNHRNDVLVAAFNAMKEADLVKELEPGLFEGCGQSFVVVR